MPVPVLDRVFDPELGRFVDVSDLDADGLRDDRPLPAHPTHHRPGTREKVAVMEARWLAGELLWHPRDATLHDDATFRVEVIEGEAKVVSHVYVSEKEYRELEEALGV